MAARSFSCDGITLGCLYAQSALKHDSDFHLLHTADANLALSQWRNGHEPACGREMRGDECARTDTPAHWCTNEQANEPWRTMPS